MALHILVMRNYAGKALESIKCLNFHSFKEGLTLLCQSILETRRMSHLHGSALFIIPSRKPEMRLLQHLVLPLFKLTGQRMQKCIKAEKKKVLTTMRTLFLFAPCIFGPSKRTTPDQ